MASWPQTFTLKRNGNDVSFSDKKGGEVGRFPYEPLLKALDGCARRFTDFMGEVARLQPGWQKLHLRLARELGVNTAAPSIT